MPPCLDVYVISHRRDRHSIEAFLNTWVDRDACEDRGDEELMILPLHAHAAPEEIHGWDWEPAVTLTRAMERGLDKPSRAFSLYLEPRDPQLYGVVLGFTTDDRVVYGLSVDDYREDRLDFAKELLNRLAQECDGELGYVAIEEGAPLVGAHLPPVGDRILFSWSRSST